MKNESAATVRELIFKSYANLAMAHAAVEQKQETYNRLSFMIRSRLQKGLKEGSMKMGTFFDDESIKFQLGSICNYCGAEENLSVDHIFSQKYGGLDHADNMICACRSCNSSKGKKDLMEWMGTRDQFLPLLVIRRYLKLVFNYYKEHELLDKTANDLYEMNLPFRIDLLPTAFPSPNKLTLTAEKPATQY